MKNFKQKSNSKGITLIALVITIIVLLILAAVSIATLTGENGILTKAGDAKNQNIVGEEKEQIKLAYDAVMTDNYEKGDYTTGVTSDKLQEHLTRQNVEATATGEGTITVTFEKSGNSYTVDGKTGEIGGPKAGNAEDNPNPQPPEEVGKTAKELLAGEYVQYIDKNNNPITCVVLYDEDYNSSNNTSYGVQIVAKEPVTDMTFGIDDPDVPVSITDNFEKALWSYNNAIKRLNDTAVNEYLNEKYTEPGKARCIGSLPNDPYHKGVDFSAYREDHYDEDDYTYTLGDDNYIEDVRQLAELGIDETLNDYWVSSLLGTYNWDSDGYYILRKLGINRSRN